MTGSSADIATAGRGIWLLLLPTVLLAACSAQRPITAVKARGAAAAASAIQQVMASLPPGSGPAVVQAVATGPVAPIAFATATVTCPAGTVLIGGGIRASIKGDGTPSPSQHVVGAFPSTSDGTAATASAGSPNSWTAIGATGAQPVPDASTMALGICDRGTAGMVAPQVIVKSTLGPFAAASSARTTAVCPGGTSLVGGGANAGLRKGWPPPPSLHITASFPSDPGGNALPPGGQPNAWTAVAATGGAPLTGAATTAYALCAPRPATGQMVVKSAIGPSGAATSFSVTARCPDGSILVFGGASTGLNQGGNDPPQGLHMRGTFPSDAAGHPFGGAAPTAWTAVAEAGGLLTLGTRTTAFAVCSGQP
jgi:hypothetical protein